MTIYSNCNFLADYTMAFRSATFALRRMMSTSAVRSSEMSFTFGGPNAVFYNAAAVKQVKLMNYIKHEERIGCLNEC